MKYALLVISFLFLVYCSKPKTVLICGDHECVNKAEAEAYFKENLSIEVKVIDKKVKEEINLVELNLKENRNGKKKISILSKKDTNKELKILTNEEVSKIKKDIKIKSKKEKIAKKIIKKKQKNINKEKKLINEDNKISEYNTNKRRKDIVDVCTIIKECSIDEISKYLLKQGKKKDFPDITTRQ